jgi:hypothetical protein
MLESKFQSSLIKELEHMFEGCIILKNDANYIQGFPDLTILYNKMWAVLECKKSENESHQPNQDYYVDVLDKMSFSRFIYPENKEEVLYELQQAFRTRGATRISKCK